MKTIPIAKNIEAGFNAPGFKLSIKPATTPKTTKSKYALDESSSLDDADIQPVGAPLAITATPTKSPAPKITQFGSNQPHVVATVPSKPNDRILARVENGGVVQWYLPVVEPVAKTTVKSAQLTERFLIPTNMLQPIVRPGIKTKSVGGAIVRFFRFKIIPELVGAATTYLLEWIVEKVEAKLKKEGVKRFETGYPICTWEELEAMRGKPVLLLIHGIFSSIGGAFRDLHGTPELAALEKRYPGRIIGFDHWTVAKTPLENAKHLMSLLPPGLDIDIVCHSRGGLITRSILEHPDHDLTRLRAEQKFRRAFFAAGANQGSALARRANWNRLLNVFFAIASLAGPNAAGVALKLLVQVLKVIAHGASRLPSIEALRPNLPDEPNPFLVELNSAISPPVTSYAVVHANFDSAQSVLLKGIDLGVDYLFENAANDLVVPFAGAAQFDPHQHSIPITVVRYGSEMLGQGVVYHTVYFGQEPVRALIENFFAP